MLAYVLALAVGLGSFAIYLAAFFFPEVHRKNDFIWSGVGLFYALVLWVCAGRITGSLLLGQVAGVALLGWSVGQTLSLRRQTPQSQTIPSTEEVKIPAKLSNLPLFNKISQIGKQVGGSATAAKDRLQQNLTAATPAPPASQTTDINSRVQIIDNRTPVPQPADIPTTVLATESNSEITQANPPEASKLDTQSSAATPPPDVVSEIDDDVIEPALTEEEAIALAVETTLVKGDEDTAAEPMRPHPPDPEIVEAAIRDAAEKHVQAAPPEPEIPENPSPS